MNKHMIGNGFDREQGFSEIEGIENGLWQIKNSSEMLSSLSI